MNIISRGGCPHHPLLIGYFTSFCVGAVFGSPSTENMPELVALEKFPKTLDERLINMI